MGSSPKLISELVNCRLLGATSTFAAIRNQIDKQRKGFIEIPKENPKDPFASKTIERISQLIWDDIDPTSLSTNSDIYRLFKNGNDRKTAVISISGEERGTNIDFKCFCPKIFSSIHPFHLLPEYSELQRRMLVIPFEKDVNSQSLLDIDSINWSGLNKEFVEFWSVEKGQKFLEVRNSIRRKNSPFGSDIKNLLLDLIATGITCELWSNWDEAIESFRVYYNWLELEKDTPGVSIKAFLKRLLSHQIEASKNSNQKPVIYSATLKNTLLEAYRDGTLVDKPGNRSIYTSMTDLGWVQEGKVWIKKSK